MNALYMIVITILFLSMFYRVSRVEIKKKQPKNHIRICSQKQNLNDHRKIMFCSSDFLIFL